MKQEVWKICTVIDEVSKSTSYDFKITEMRIKRFIWSTGTATVSENESVQILNSELLKNCNGRDCLYRSENIGPSKPIFNLQLSCKY